MWRRLLLLAAAAPGASVSTGPRVCDTIGVCRNGCPGGMELVGPPARSGVYRIEADVTSYTPNELVQLRIEVTAREIQAMRKAGTAQCYCQEKNSNNKRCPDESGVCDCVCTAAGECTHPEGTARKVTRGCTLTGPVMETSKYLGLLMYAVKADDPNETKVGGWEVPVEPSARFKTMGGPGCDDRALVQTGAGAKLFSETFWWRAPEAGTGPVVMRALLKQGETLGGHFYWPDAGNGDGTPAPGVAGGDLVLAEGAPAAPAAVEWVRGKPGESCNAVCADVGRGYDPSAFSDAESPSGLLSQVSGKYICAAPLLSSCDAYAPAGSGGGTAWCCSPTATRAPPTSRRRSATHRRPTRWRSPPACDSVRAVPSAAADSRAGSATWRRSKQDTWRRRSSKQATWRRSKQDTWRRRSSQQDTWRSSQQDTWHSSRNRPSHAPSLNPRHPGEFSPKWAERRPHRARSPRTRSR